MAAAVVLAKLERPAPAAKGEIDWAVVCQEAAEKSSRANAKTAGWENRSIFGSYTVARKLPWAVAVI